MRAAFAALAVGLILPGVAGARPTFTPSDPLASKQYYLAQDHAFDFNMTFFLFFHEQEVN